jgi:serine protease Do
MSSVMLPLLLTAFLQAEPAAEELDSLKESAIRAAVRRVSPSIVRIETAGVAEQTGPKAVSTAPTTGVVLTADGWIAASAYQLIGNPAGVVATLPDGTRLSARVAGERSYS